GLSTGKQLQQAFIPLLQTITSSNTDNNEQQLKFSIQYYLPFIMKCQKSISDWFSSKMTKSLVSSSSSENNDLITENTDDNNFGDENIIKVESSENVPTMEEDLHDCENVVPDCWTSKQAKSLAVPTVQRRHIWRSLEENLYTFLRNGKSVLLKHPELIKKVQQASLRKKMKEHFESSSHLRVINILNESKKEPLTTVIDKFTEQNIAITSKIFNIVYSLVKRNRPMSDMEDEVELQIENESDLGNCLHSRFSAIRIVEHIAELIRKQIFSKIIENYSKICIIIDEASTVSSKTVLVILLKCELQDPSPTIFLDLVELQSTKTENIYNKDLIGFCSDGASTMLGHKSGVATRLIEDFPNILICHCLNHWLQLALDDAINYINEVSHFKIFLDKIYAIFHQSNKSQFELKQFSEELYIEIIKIGRVFGPRWASCNLALMINILDELELLSNALQVRQLNKVIECIIEKMKARLLNKKHIKYKEDNLGHSCNTPKIVELFNVTDPTSWNIEEVRLPWKSGEKVHELSKFIKFVVDLNDFCDYVDNNIQSKNLPDPETIRKAKQIMNTIAISSAEADRAFSLMNIICSDKRANLTIKHISSFMTINLLGNPLSS
uniref:DUF4371 domain-containing protein n=1 Tax=Chelonoidis abingdonii TaxID=106734 RepID=A0A8C0QS39_CHEAB